MTPGNCDQCGRWGPRRISGLRPFPALCSACLQEFEGPRALPPVPVQKPATRPAYYRSVGPPIRATSAPIRFDKP